MANIYTIYNSENQRIGQTPIRRQAENAALGYAKRLGRVLLWNGGEVWQGVMA